MLERLKLQYQNAMPRNFTIHDTRRLAASTIIANSQGMDAAKDLLAHKSVKTTADYINLDPVELFKEQDNVFSSAKDEVKNNLDDQ